MSEAAEVAAMRRALLRAGSCLACKSVFLPRLVAAIVVAWYAGWIGSMRRRS